MIKVGQIYNRKWELNKLKIQKQVKVTKIKYPNIYYIVLSCEGNSKIVGSTQDLKIDRFKAVYELIKDIKQRNLPDWF